MTCCSSVQILTAGGIMKQCFDEQFCFVCVLHHQHTCDAIHILHILLTAGDSNMPGIVAVQEQKVGHETLNAVLYGFLTFFIWLFF